MDKITFEELLNSKEIINDNEDTNQIDEIIGDGCFLYLQMVSDQEIKMLLATTENKNSLSFAIKPKYDETDGRITLSCEGLVGDSYIDNMYIKTKLSNNGVSLLEENINLKNKASYLEKNISRLELLLAAEKAKNILKINELKDSVHLLESHMQFSEKKFQT